jgi:hypothetical protein
MYFFASRSISSARLSGCPGKRFMMYPGRSTSWLKIQCSRINNLIFETSEKERKKERMTHRKLNTSTNQKEIPVNQRQMEKIFSEQFRGR